MHQVEETSYTRLCITNKILTVNGQFPGPALNVQKGETIRVNVWNKGDYNVTMHWYYTNKLVLVMFSSFSSDDFTYGNF